MQEQQSMEGQKERLLEELEAQGTSWEQGLRGRCNRCRQPRYLNHGLCLKCAIIMTWGEYDAMRG